MPTIALSALTCSLLSSCHSPLSPSPPAQRTNHHLTELCKLTFHKRDPTRVTIYYRGEHGDDAPVKETFSVTDHKAFIAALQANLKALQGL